ncbi:hypothetical protein [Clostridium kluyveri]|uniref:hypothetical protein n=1 Tax=Clostridium kluyveri TaxID=1534 RepID=UPI00224565B5|nr:hypothetical protein [Clostridium kluyveri]UZQ49865.1 hypothetical protein OP486_18245 [Clostridium kluyveri]
MDRNMEFWLKQDDIPSNYIHLPVPPANYNITWADNNSSFNVEGMGEVSFLGKPKLTEITPIESFFPYRYNTYCQYKDFPAPADCVVTIQKMKLSGKPVRFIITKTLVNILCSIENFQFGEKDGTGDIYYTLQLKEYKVLK